MVCYEEVPLYTYIIILLSRSVKHFVLVILMFNTSLVAIYLQHKY